MPAPIMSARRPMPEPLRAFVRRSLLLFVLLFGVSPALADVVELKDGRRIEGVILVQNEKLVRIETRFGELEFPRSDVVKIEKGKTKEQEFAEREAKAESAEDFYQLGLWAREKRLKRQAKRCMQRAVELDPKHEGANRYLGFVLYKGEWMTPEERDRRMALDHEQEMRDKGLVRYEERWVTLEEKSKLEQGMLLYEGRWMPHDEAMRAQGLADYNGEWLPEVEVVARKDVDAAAAIARVKFQTAVTELAILAGDVDRKRLEVVGALLDKGRARFDKGFGVEPGLALFGGRLAQLYLFENSSAPYEGSVEHFGSLTETVPDGWALAVKKTHGFLWWDPYPLSSARRWKRSSEDLDGHCYHHWGHLLLNRLGYDGRLLPPWYDEGFAAVMEYELHGRNAVFCRVHEGVGRGTRAAKQTFDFDPRRLREGEWFQILARALRENRVPSFDALAQLEFFQLELIDIATSMVIVSWLSEKGALRRFHDGLRRHAPAVPQRVVTNAHERQRIYDEIFQEAVGLSWREADKAWRAWALSR